MIRKYLDNNIDGSMHFKWKEALWLPQWEIYSFPIDSFVWQNIIEITVKLEAIRKIFGNEILISSWYRPKKYNQLIGGALKSQHIIGKAVDFNISGLNPNSVRNHLMPRLSMLDIRMENLKDSSWVHIDTATKPDMTIKERYFKP